MISFTRYPHVRDLLIHYAKNLNFNEIIQILDTRVENELDAEKLSRFIWSVADKMSEDCNSGVLVLGRKDNSDMLPDVEYEVTLYLSGLGFEQVWDRVSDEENP